MSVEKSPQYHQVVRSVARWCAWYTRNIDREVASARRDELASDLHEHAQWADQSKATPRATARAILGRAVRGIPADLAWRHTQRRQFAAANPVAFRQRRVDNVGWALVLAAASALLGWGVFVLARIALSTIAGEIRPFSDTALILTAFTLLAIAGLVLLLRRRTRVVGALVMVIPSIGLIHFGFYQLYSLSTTVGALMFTMPGWDFASTSAIAGLGLFFIAAAIWWWPDRSVIATETHIRMPKGVENR